MARILTFSDDTHLAEIAEHLRPKVVSRAEAKIRKQVALNRWLGHLGGIAISAAMWWALIYGGMKLYAWLTRIGLL